MFHFPGCPPMRLSFHLMVTGHCPGRVPPFGYPRIYAHLQLPAAFRSLSRPSSAISALASTLRSSSLDLASITPAFLRLLRRGRNPLIFFFLCVSSLCSFQGALSAGCARRLSLPRSPALSLLADEVSLSQTLKTIQSLPRVPSDIGSVLQALASPFSRNRLRFRSRPVPLDLGI